MHYSRLCSGGQLLKGDSQGLRKDAYDARRICNWFTEGFDTADLKDAQFLKLKIVILEVGGISTSIVFTRGCLRALVAMVDFKYSETTLIESTFAEALTNGRNMDLNYTSEEESFRQFHD
jgi:hypothetical protein